MNVEYAGQTIANQVTVPVGVGGEVSIFLPAGGQVLADVFGYYSPSSASTDGRYTPLQAPTPRRVLDTRDPLQVPIANPGNAVDCGHFATWNEAWHWFWTYHRWGDPAFLDGNTGRPANCDKLLPADPENDGNNRRIQVACESLEVAGLNNRLRAPPR